MKKTLASAMVVLIRQSGEIALRELIREKIRNCWKSSKSKKVDKTSA